jgi:hypothetical protein
LFVFGAICEACLAFYHVNLVWLVHV